MRPLPLKSIYLLFAAGIISAILVFFFFNFLPGKTIGSFEYVRKAEDLLEKGKYRQAIAYFEKACESSPDNKIIRSGLVYAYSMYSNALAKENKHDLAIDYLDKAYDLTPNSSTAQNLAAFYFDKALKEAKKGALEDARDSYGKARQYAGISDTVSRNLAAMLYNEGVNEFRSGNEDTAILCLKESSLIYKDSRIFELLGDLYYKKAQLRKARFYWHMGMLLDPANKVLADKMSRVVKEMALSSKGNVAELPHFKMIYMGDLPIDKEIATRILENAYVDVGKDLGYFPGEKTKVFFYSKEDFRKTFNMPYFVKAFYDGSIKIPAPEDRLDKEKFAEYIYHEYTHAIVSAKTNNNCPDWLSEGIAVWQDFKRANVSPGSVAKNIRSMPDISFKFLDESFRTSEFTKNKALCYIISYTLVDFILNKWGINGLRGVLKRLGNKQHIANAIDDQFLIPEGDFEKKWREHSIKKFFNNI
jgi:tetratricopeptide (TPR) repeat protein